MANTRSARISKAGRLTAVLTFTLLGAGGVLAQEMLSPGLTAGARKPAPKAPNAGLINDYPTAARADYVFACMIVNGQTRQDWSTNDMIFNCSQLISFASGIMTLKPGDVMFTGTPQGVIFGEKAPPEERRWLRAGDEIVSTLEGLGDLRFTLT